MYLYIYSFVYLLIYLLTYLLTCLLAYLFFILFIFYFIYLFIYLQPFTLFERHRQTDRQTEEEEYLYFKLNIITGRQNANIL